MHETGCPRGAPFAGVALAGVLVVSAWTAEASPGSVPARGFAGATPVSGGIGRASHPPLLLEPPRSHAHAFLDDLLAQRVLDEDEKKPKPPGQDDGAETSIARPSYRSPWLAMGLSAVLPGAGQFYLNKQNPLAFAYVGVEALALYLHFQWESDGDEKTREYEQYAWQGVVHPMNDAPRNEIVSEQGHWSWERWRDSFGQPEGCLQPDNIDYLATDSTLVDFWFNNRREFFEDIGKYDKYDCGWLSAEFRDIYRSMRNETNDILQRARLMTQVVLLNHLASSVHAFFLARSHNKRVAELEREASLRELRWQFAPDHDFRGLRAELWLTQRF